MRDMHWKVYLEDWNAREIIEYDIFGHGLFADYVRKAYRKHRTDFDAFSKEVRGALMYCFWSKCEYETLWGEYSQEEGKHEPSVGSWIATVRVKPRKVDVHDQVMLNWDVFIRYVWHQAHARKESGE